MKRVVFLAVAAALVLAATAAAGGPPTGQPLGPPINLPWPKPGKVAFVSVVLTGVLKSGAAPTLQPVAYGRPSTDERLAGARTKPKTVGGTTKVTFYFAIKNIATARRLARGRIAPPPQVDIFGNPVQWVSVKENLPVILNCLRIKAALLAAVQLYDIYSFGDTPKEMWDGALKFCS
ncbi:MAG TPA: hypothetical protein VGH92_06080 [Gaiellaceae bacterium]